MINDLLDLMTPLELSNTKYYNLESFIDIVKRFSNEKIEIEDTIILPFYIYKVRF